MPCALVLAFAGCGQVAGWADAYRLVDLGTLSDGPAETRFSFATDIDDRGWVTGYSGTAAGDTHAFLFDGTLRDLGTLGGTTSIAYGFSPSGAVVGHSTIASGLLHKFSYDGVMHDLGPVGNTIGLLLARAAGLTAVGGEADAQGQLTAYLDDGTRQSLGTLGGRSSYALGLNADGAVVGFAETGTGDQHAFLYAEGALTDLNTPAVSATGWILRSAKSINDSGQIVGFGTYRDQSRAFLLEPTAPEAGTIAGAIATALAVGAAWWRRRGRPA